MNGVAAKRVLASVAVFCAVFGGRVAVAQVCQRPELGWRENCEYSDSNCEGGYHARYHTYNYTAEYLTRLDELDTGNHMALITLGDGSQSGSAWSRGYDTDSPTDERSFPTYLVRVAADARVPDIERPAILFVGSLHAFEWIASEVALGYLDYLVQGANSGDGAVSDLLDEAEFWFLVQGNAGGRAWSDLGTSGNPNATVNVQRKNMQWVFEARSDATSWSDGAVRSGYCDFSTTGALESDGIAKWDYWGINVENSISAVWPGWGSSPYDRTAMVKHLADVNGTTPKTDYANTGELAPELFPCTPGAATGTFSNCATHFPPLTGGLGGHTHCVQRGTDYSSGTAEPVYGCFMIDPDSGDYDKTTLVSSDSDGPPGCATFVAGNPDAVTDELGIRHVCRLTEVRPLEYDFLLWECGMTGPDPASGGPLLAYCHDGVRSSCHFEDGVDGCATAIPDSAFAPESVHHRGQRFCSRSDGLYCAVSYYRTPCSVEYRGTRPFEAIEARILRTVGDNLPFSFVVDMHSAENTMSGTCKNMANGCCDRPDPATGCAARNDSYDRIATTRKDLVDAYNAGVAEHWHSYSGDSSDPPDLLEMTFGSIDMTIDTDGNPTAGGSQFPVWMSNMPTVTADTDDTSTTSANFDNGTFRGVTSFLWELGVPALTQEQWNSPTSIDTEDKPVLAKLLNCTNNTDIPPNNGSTPLSSLFLKNQLAGMKRMADYLASRAQIPDMPPQSGIPRLSLAGLRLHDGHGRGIQQIETRHDLVDVDPTAETVIPAGLWEVEVDALAGANNTSQLLNGEVTLTQKVRVGNAWLRVVSETIPITNLPGGSRAPVARRFDFKADQTYRIEARVSGTDSCSAAGSPACSAANDLLVAKMTVIGCGDTDSLPNGIGADEFCQSGLPFADTRFDCNGTVGRCRECWATPWSTQNCEDDEFCFEGMCDDATTCWSGEITDQYEGSSENESPPTIIANGSPTTRTLHLQNLWGAAVQDVDTLETTLSSSAISDLVLMYRMKLNIWNLCEDDIDLDDWGVPLPGDMEELEVRVQAQNPFSFPDSDAGYVNITESGDDDWVKIDRREGMELDIPAFASSSLTNGRKVRIQVRNVTPYQDNSVPYSLDVSLNDNGYAFPEFHVKEWPWEKALWPMETIDVEVDPGEVVSISPVDEGIANGFSVFFRPAAGYENVAQQTVQFRLVTSDGQVPTNDNGMELAPTVHKDGGLAIPLGALDLKLGPYEVRLATTAEHVEGSVYLCSANAQNCRTFNPRTSTCGDTCTGEGVRCCADEDRNYTCSNLKGSDVTNCGACGNTCDWDEKCLKGVCVKGRATSCWNTTCPESTECVSKDFLFLRNPQCRATMVDRTWCGWFGTVCGSTQDCVLGLCLPKMNVSCGLKCLEEGQTCCWVNGVETCVDVASSWARCGSCGKSCAANEMCSGGKCEPWYSVAKVCPGEGRMNCSRTGISCKNILNDPENCGGCGIPCPDSGWCANGQCVVRVEETGNVH